MKENAIEITGARENNLKNLSLCIPKNKIVVISGPSGSGKSSLAFDTIHAEAQWRYIESLTQSSKLFLNKLPRPKLDSIQGLNPSIALKQGNIPSSGRNVGNFSEITQLLSVIFTRQGRAYCPGCNKLLKASTVQSIVDELSDLDRDSKLEIMAPMSFEDSPQLIKLRESGIVRLKINNRDYRLDEGIEEIPLESGYIVFDRLKVGNSSRIFDSVESAIKLGAGKVSILVNEAQLLNFQDLASCEDCGIEVPEIKTQLFSFDQNSELKKETTWIRLGDYSFADYVLAPVSNLVKMLETIKTIDNTAPILKQIKSRVDLFIRLGLGDLTLLRDLSRLSSGEIQRLRLVSLLAAELSGVIYILDEPSAHLDVKTIQKVLELILELRNRENSVLIVDHHPEIIKAAEYLIEIGPGAGEHGGQIVYSGAAKEIKHELKISEPKEIKFPEMKFKLPEILSDQLLSIPSNSIVALTGDSGSGKTNLLINGIVPAVSEFNVDNYSGPKFNKVVSLESTYSAKTLRSNPASLLDVFSSIRELFAGVADAKIRGFTASRFSFNVKGGRCEDCQGAGVRKLDLSVLTDLYVECETCEGKRYNRDTLSIKYKGLNINEVLELSIAEAANFFRQVPNIYSSLLSACEVGVGYLALGQAANSISGGEYQRLRVAEALSSSNRGSVLFILDEPCLGLHASDVEVLIKLLNRITAKGNTVVLATQNMNLLSAADYVVHLVKGEKRLKYAGAATSFLKESGF